jgi:hypothetical protein
MTKGAETVKVLQKTIPLRRKCESLCQKHRVHRSSGDIQTTHVSPLSAGEKFFIHASPSSYCGK